MELAMEKVPRQVKELEVHGNENPTRSPRCWNEVLSIKAMEQERAEFGIWEPTLFPEGGWCQD